MFWRRSPQQAARAALDWYGSEVYAAIRKIREGAARARLYVVDGID